MNINHIENFNKTYSFSNSNIHKQSLRPAYIGDSYSFNRNLESKKSVNFGNTILEKFKTIAKEKYANLSSNQIFKGLEEHFFKLHAKLIHEITLTTEQKEILAKKIQDFENYKSNLTPEQLNELEKNKYSMLDFVLINGKPDKNLKGYKHFLKRYEQFKKGNFNGITNEELSQLLYYTDTTDLIRDGKIGSFAQGRTGDCWFLSMLNNCASTIDGERNIAQRISQADKEGNYTVTFDNPFNQNEKIKIQVTLQDLQNYDLSNENTYYSSGDLDVRILESAADKLIHQYLKDGVEIPNKNVFDDIENELNLQEEKQLAGQIACGFPEKRLLIYRALGYKGEMKDYYTSDSKELNKYCSKEFLNAANAKVYSITYLLSEENGKIKLTPEVKATQYNSLSEVITGENLKADELICGTGDKEYSDNKKDQRYISTGHAYNFMNYNAEDESITVNDPYNSAFPHTITKEKFDTLYTQLTYLPSIF